MFDLPLIAGRGSGRSPAVSVIGRIDRKSTRSLGFLRIRLCAMHNIDRTELENVGANVTMQLVARNMRVRIFRRHPKGKYP
jgi:hypothetical protein